MSGVDAAVDIVLSLPEPLEAKVLTEACNDLRKRGFAVSVAQPDLIGLAVGARLSAAIEADLNLRSDK